MKWLKAMEEKRESKKMGMRGRMIREW